MFNAIRSIIKGALDIFLTIPVQAYTRNAKLRKKGKEESLRKQDLEKWIEESW